MKETKLLVKVRCTHRNFYLCKVNGSDSWHIIFTPPYEARKLGAPKRVVRSTGVRVGAPISLAKQAAAAIIEDYWKTDKPGEIAETKKLRSSYPTIGQLLDAYAPRPSSNKRETVWRNKCALIKLLKDVFELDTREKVEALRCDVLSEDTAKRFLTIRETRGQARADGDMRMFNTACTSANSCLNQSRCVISPRLECYASFKLPDFSGFRKVPYLRVSKTHTKYVSPGAAVFDAMDRDIYKVRESQPFVFAAYWFLRYLGLRPSELVNARWNWIDRTPRGSYVFKVMLRPDFKPKNDVSRDVPIAPEAKRLFDEISAGAMPTAYIINLPWVTDRERVLKYELNQWMRRYLPKNESEKCAYVLRKEAGSLYFHAYGIEAAAQFLGDTIEMAKAHYLRDKELEYGVTLTPAPAAALRSA
jgi:hypothetical protein